MILDEDFLDELRVQIVMNNLCLSNFGPTLALLLIDDAKRVRL